MKNILLILQHEYYTRVSKRSFIVMTLLGPLLIALFYGSIAALSVYQLQGSEAKEVAVYDASGSLKESMKESDDFRFYFVDDPDEGRKDLKEGMADILLEISPLNRDSVVMTAEKSLSLSDKQELKALISEQYFNNELSGKGLSAGMIDSLRHDIRISDRLTSGESSATEIRSGIGYIGAFIIYMFIFMYGVMIMRGVTEEKNNRIVEIIISAVKPFELMMGKILGVALVGLTQFISWIVLSSVLILFLGILFGMSSVDTAAMQQAGEQVNNAGTGMLQEILFQLGSLNFAKILTGFILFFLGGFLLYSSLFAAIGSAVDSDTETQQFMFPVSMPLIFGLVIAQIAVIKDPNSQLAFWSSMIPFTSPVVMMVRLPFDVSWTEIITSALILFTSFVLVVWLAGKIYRIGILSHGQKASYKQMLKWLMMKE